MKATRGSGATSPSLRVRGERVGSATVVLHLEGRLTLEADTLQLHELVRAISQFGPCHVILDFGDVGQLDCSGIGQLVQLRNLVCGADRVFALINVDRRQQRILEILGLLTVLRVAGSREKAIGECPSTVRALALPPSARPTTAPDTVRASDKRVLQQAV